MENGQLKKSNEFAKSKEKVAEKNNNKLIKTILQISIMIMELIMIIIIIIIIVILIKYHFNPINDFSE